MQHIADKRKIELVPPEVSSEDKLFFDNIYGDKNRFIQVIINFLSNSLKFSKPESKICLGLSIVEKQFLNHTSVEVEEKNV